MKVLRHIESWEMGRKLNRATGRVVDLKANWSGNRFAAGKVIRLFTFND